VSKNRLISTISSPSYLTVALKVVSVLGMMSRAASLLVYAPNGGRNELTLDLMS